MLSPSSNCCRVDAVKASVNQLRLQVPQQKADAVNDTATRIANQQLQSADAQIKSGDADKAELALSAAHAAVQHLQSQQPVQHNEHARSHSYGTLDVYA